MVHKTWKEKSIKVKTIVMVFFNLIIADDDDICSLYTMRKYSGIPLVKRRKRRSYEVNDNRNAKK